MMYVRVLQTQIAAAIFNADGNLYIVDISFGRIFRISPGGDWSLIVEYNGEPKGLKFHQDGRILVEAFTPSRRVALGGLAPL